VKSLISIQTFLKRESVSGIILCITALLAILLENSPWASVYQAFRQLPTYLSFDQWHFQAPLLFWINEGLMTFFFLLVGLELKREFLIGELANKKLVVLPAVAALGGMLIPAFIYVLINWSNPSALKGWAIPVATDIAFALGVLSLF
jgi:NhaA family Na+:H+ antiporter